MSKSFTPRAVFELDSLPSVKSPGEILEAGDRCPDFFFASLDGSTFDLSCFAREKLWIAFYRYGGCPICRVHFNEVMQIQEQLRSQGVRFVAVFDCGRENVPAWLASAAEKMVISVSGDNADLYDRFGVEKSWRKLLSLQTVSARVQAGLKGEKEENVDGAFNRIPAHFLINPGGEIKVAHYGRSAGDQIAWSDVWAFVKEPVPLKFTQLTEDPLPEAHTDASAHAEPRATFEVRYCWVVKTSREDEFIQTWKTMQAAISEKFPGLVSAELSRTGSGEFIGSSKWQSRDAWEKFWVTKELVISEVSALRFLIQKSSEPEFSLSIAVHVGGGSRGAL